MAKRMEFVVMLALLFCASLGCGLLSGTPEPASAPESGMQEGAAPPNAAGAVENARWPADLPADIPVIDAGITQVMGSPDTTLRLFLEPLTDAQVARYVAACERNGFTVEFIVYVEEGFPDHSEERLEAGDFDAVDFAKHPIFMRLENGSDLATLDIRIASTAPQPSPTPLPWPADLSVPPPEGCAPGSIANLSYGGYQITCNVSNVDASLAAYLQTLDSLGFEEKDRLINEDDEIVEVLLESDGLTVKLMPHGLSSTLTLQIAPKAP